MTTGADSAGERARLAGITATPRLALNVCSGVGAAATGGGSAGSPVSVAGVPQAASSKTQPAAIDRIHQQTAPLCAAARHRPALRRAAKTRLIVGNSPVGWVAFDPTRAQNARRDEVGQLALGRWRCVGRFARTTRVSNAAVGRIGVFRRFSRNQTQPTWAADVTPLRPLLAPVAPHRAKRRFEAAGEFPRSAQGRGADPFAQAGAQRREARQIFSQLL